MPNTAIPSISGLRGQPDSGQPTSTQNYGIMSIENNAHQQRQQHQQQNQQHQQHGIEQHLYTTAQDQRTPHILTEQTIYQQQIHNQSNTCSSASTASAPPLSNTNQNGANQYSTQILSNNNNNNFEQPYYSSSSQNYNQQQLQPQPQCESIQQQNQNNDNSNNNSSSINNHSNCNSNNINNNANSNINNNEPYQTRQSLSYAHQNILDTILDSLKYQNGYLNACTTLINQYSDNNIYSPENEERLVKCFEVSLLFKFLFFLAVSYN